MGVKNVFSLSFLSKKKQESIFQNETRRNSIASDTSLPSTSSSSTSVNSASLTSITRRVLVWQRGYRASSSSLSLDSDAGDETSIPCSKARSQPPTYDSHFQSSPLPPPSPQLGISSEARESIRARMERDHRRRRGLRRGDSHNAPRATDLGIAIRYGESPPSLEIQNAAMLTDAHSGATASTHAELPPPYVERTPCLPTYDLVMTMRRQQHSTGRSHPNRQTSLPVWFDSAHRQRRRNEESVSRRRQLGRVEAMIRQERQRSMREREESHERRVQQQQARLDTASPLGAFIGNEALELSLNDREMEVLLRAFGVPAQ